jgi:hypothetical protein
MTPVMMHAAAALTARQAQTLNAIAQLIIPRGADGRRPGGPDVGLAEHVTRMGKLDWLLPGLDGADAAAHDAHGLPFAELDSAQQLAVVEARKRKEFRMYGELANQLMLCYYQHEHVLPAIGMEARAPFPLGYYPIEGDVSLLEPVYERGPIWREC